MAAECREAKADVVSNTDEVLERGWGADWGRWGADWDAFEEVAENE